MTSNPTANAVKFRLLGDQLTDTEFNIFLSKIIEAFGKDIIFTSLFHLFINSSQTNKYFHQINKANTTISDIIKSRKIKPKKITKISTISQLPKELIGHLSSFLTQKCYFSFNVTNRSIFIGCNSPNTLQKLSLHKLKNYSNINLNKFPLLKHLKFTHHKFHTLPSNLTTNNLNSLTISGQKLSLLNIKPFITQNSINLKNITTLNCVRFGKNQRMNRCINPLQFLSQFPNIECLKMSAFYANFTSEEISYDKLKQLFPKLVDFSFGIGSVTFGNNMIRTFANNLRALTFVSNKNRIIIPSYIKFDKLEELMISSPRYQTVKNTLTTAGHLKKFRLNHASKYLSQLEMKEIIQKVFEKQSLEYFKFTIQNEFFQNVCDAILMALIKTKNLQREYIKICVGVLDSVNVNEVIVTIETQIYNILKVLLESNIKDFMFRLSFKNTKDLIAKPKILDALAISYYSDLRRITFTNQNCSICGSSTKWLAPLMPA